MELWQALLLGALQGISELFPVSSLAHIILIPALLNWNIDYGGTHFLSFVVALHLATAVALVIYFWEEWRAVILAYVGSIRRREIVYDRDSKFAWLLVAGTIVAGLFGLIFEKPLRQFFEDPAYFWLSAVLLILNGGIMLYGEYLRRSIGTRTHTGNSAQGVSGAMGSGTQGLRGEGVSEPQAQSTTSAVQQIESPALAPARATAQKADSKQAEDLTFPQGAGIGATQILALFPGISRSGVTIVGGLLAGLSHEAAARFSFMLATPIIGLAALLKVPDLFKPDVRDLLVTTCAAALVAGVVAYLSVRFLMRYFETRRLSPFGYYCMAFGLLSLIVLFARR